MYSKGHRGTVYGYKIPITADIYQTIKESVATKPPNVPSFCFYGTGFKTEIRYDYVDDFTYQPYITYSYTGDGTVPMESLTFCDKWKRLQTKKVVAKDFHLDHQGILESDEIFEYIIKITTNNSINIK